MTSNKTIGRLAGLAYLGVVLTGFYSLAYVPSRLIDMSDPVKTLADIAAADALFRASIAAQFVCYVFFLVLPILLFRLLEPFGRISAALMVVFVVASVPLTFHNLSHKLAILPLVEQFASSPHAAGLADQAMQHLRAYNRGISIATIFWGLWLFPFGYLVAKSGVIPRILGIFLMLGCLGYLANFFGPLLWPPYKVTVLPNLVDKPATIGEIGSCLWLLIMGAREAPR